MRFVVVVAEIIGNMSTPAQYMGPGNIDLGSPIHLAIGEVFMSLRALPCIQRASHAFAAAAKVVSGGGLRPAA